jgi:hypothetical protein
MGRIAAALCVALALAGCAESASAPPAAAPRPAAAPAARPADPARAAADAEAQQLGLDLAIAMITSECEDAAVRAQALRTRAAVLELTRLVTQANPARGDQVWAEAEMVMARQRTRPGQAECQRALPALRDAERMARDAAR